MSYSKYTREEKQIAGKIGDLQRRICYYRQKIKKFEIEFSTLKKKLNGKYQEKP